MKRIRDAWLVLTGRAEIRQPSVNVNLIYNWAQPEPAGITFDGSTLGFYGTDLKEHDHVGFTVLA